MTVPSSYGLMGSANARNPLAVRVFIRGREGRGITLTLEVPLPQEEAQ